MTRFNSTVKNTTTSKSRFTVWVTTLWLASWTTWSGCAPRVIESARVVTPLKAGQTFTAPADGVFMSEDLYQRTRRAVADKVLELNPPSRATEDRPK